MQRLNMIPYEHVEDFENFKNGYHNTWFPTQILMGDDKLQFDRLMPEWQRHLARTNLANLTTSDVQIMDNVEDGIGAALKHHGFLEAPETRMMLALQAAQEGLHTWSYQHILESLGMNQQEQADFYTLWKREPAIKAKIDYAQQVTRDLADGSYRTDHLAPLLAYYWLLFEGGWFWSGFGINWALTNAYTHNNRPCMYGTAEQLTYIARDESQHVQFGLQMVYRIADRLGFNVEAFREMASEVIKLESAYVNMAMTQPVLHYNRQTHVDFVQYMLNIRFQQLGLDPMYPLIGNPAPWRDRFESQQEKNFFETHVNEYRSGADLWQEDSDEMHKIINWQHED